MQLLSGPRSSNISATAATTANSFAAASVAAATSSDAPATSSDACSSDPAIAQLLNADVAAALSAANGAVNRSTSTLTTPDGT
eukprot:7204972-Prymnesium_polylepis.1